MEITLNININLPSYVEALVQAFLEKQVETNTKSNANEPEEQVLHEVTHPALKQPVKIPVEPVQTKPATKKLGLKKPVETKPAPANEPESEQAASADAIDFDALRKKLMEKVDANRDAIKAELDRLGVSKISQLKQEQYPEMYNFLVSLK